jgi:hypothetical protein
MCLQIELEELEQCRRILQRQCRTNGALMLCAAVETQHDPERGDGPCLPANTLQQRRRHAGEQKQQAFQLLYRKVQFHSLHQTGFEARFYREHQVRPRATRERMQLLSRLTEPRNQICLC